MRMIAYAGIPYFLILATACSTQPNPGEGSGGEGGSGSSSISAGGNGGSAGTGGSGGSAGAGGSGGGSVTPGPSGSVDTSFGEKGYYTYNAKPQTATGDVRLCAEATGFVAYMRPYVMRFMLDGTLDPSVDVTQPKGNYEQFLPAGAGKWLGRGFDSFLKVKLERLDAKFELDPTFDATAALMDMPQPFNAAVAPDDSVFLVGTDSSMSPSQILLRKLTPTGAIDTTFGVGGTAISAFPTGVGGREIAFQKDGKIVVGAMTGLTPAIARFAPDGTVDESYGDKGIVTTTGTQLSEIKQLMLDDQGRALVLTTNFLVARILDTGAMDQSYGYYMGIGGGGYIPTSPDEKEHATSMVPLPDGKLILGGTVSMDPDGNGVDNTGSVILARIDATGKLDKSFGTDGAARIQLDNAPELSIMAERQGVILLPDGRLAVGGLKSPNLGANGVVAVVWQ